MPQGQARQGAASRPARLAALLLLLAVASAPRARAAATTWQAAALGRLEELESALGEKEQQLRQVRTDLAAARAAEERGARRFVRRAAFDVGSAACKILVADVDLHAGSAPAITKVVLSDRVAVQLSDDLAAGGGARFSERALQELRDVLLEFKKRAEEQGAEQFAGVATAAFREASNGPGFLMQLKDEGLPLRLVSQEREALLGFLTANHLCPHIASHDLVSWDCGGGSLQITAEVPATAAQPHGWDAWMRATGTSVAKTTLVSEVQQKSAASSPNPVSLTEAQTLARVLGTMLGTPPPWLTDRLQAPGVHFAAIGGETSLFQLASELVDSTRISKASLLEAIENLCGKTDLELRLIEEVPAAAQQPQTVIPKLVLLYAVLNALGCDAVTYHTTNGNTPGVLMTQEIWT